MTAQGCSRSFLQIGYGLTMQGTNAAMRSSGGFGRGMGRARRGTWRRFDREGIVWMLCLDYGGFGLMVIG